MATKRLKKTLSVLIVTALFAVFAAACTKPPALFGEAPYIICLDPGHGGTDVGATDAGVTRMEKDDNLALALAVRDSLTSLGYTVIMTRDSDVAVELESRAAFANENNASIFVSLHRNSGGGKGVEVWVASQPDEADMQLGKAILDGIVDAGVNNNRGLRKGTAANAEVDYAVIRGAAMPRCLVEMGFMDSDSDNDLFDVNLDVYASAIAGSIANLIPIESD